MSRTQDTPETVELTITLDDAIGGADPEKLGDETVADAIEWEKDIQRSQALRERARERIDEDDLPGAQSLLWVDHAEVYALCGGCYHENRDGAWTGSTRNPDYEQLREAMHEKLANGDPCAFCKSERVKELKEEIADEYEFDFTVEGWDDA